MQDLKDVIPIWGAVLSTILAIIKIGELWAARQKIEISGSFTGSAEIGNEIIIRNLSGKPIIITYWEILFVKKSGLKWTIYNRQGPGEDVSDICINGHTSTTLNFRDMYYFDWSHDCHHKKRIYFEVFLAGNKFPIKRFLYKQY